MTTGEIFLTIFIAIIILIIIGFIIFRFFIAHRGSSVGEVCNSDDDCLAGLYCGGGNQCVVGSSGKKQGASCTANANCEVGLLCALDPTNMTGTCQPVLRTGF